MDTTNICTREILGSDPPGRACPDCQHADLVHRGWPNPDPEMTGCLVCELKATIAEGRHAIAETLTRRESRGHGAGGGYSASGVPGAEGVSRVP